MKKIIALLSLICAVSSCSDYKYVKSEVHFYNGDIDTLEFRDVFFIRKDSSLCVQYIMSGDFHSIARGVKYVKVLKQV